jgi:hypothetical protein
MQFQSKGANLATAGTSFTHGLTKSGLAVAPDDWAVNLRAINAAGAQPSASIYVSGAPSTTAIVVAVSGAAGSGDVFCWANHSIIQ